MAQMDELFQGRSYLQAMLEGGGGMRFFKPGSSRGCADVAASAETTQRQVRPKNPYEGMFDADNDDEDKAPQPPTLGPGRWREHQLLAKAATEEGLTDKEHAMLQKVQIRPSKASGPSKLMAQAMVLGWVSLLPYVMMNTPL